MTSDWIQELKNKSKGVRTAFTQLRKEHNYTQLGKLYSQIQAIIDTDPSISKLQDDNQRWLLAITQLDKNLSLR